MSDASIGTPEQLKDPNYTPPLTQVEQPFEVSQELVMLYTNPHFMASQ